VVRWELLRWIGAFLNAHEIELPFLTFALGGGSLSATIVGVGSLVLFALVGVIAILRIILVFLPLLCPYYGAVVFYAYYFI
jgi:hypothetical protein